MRHFATFRFWAILLPGLALAFLLINCKCDDQPKPPGFDAAQLAAVLNLAATGVEAGQGAAIANKDFDGCMGAGVGAAILKVVADTAPAIEDEVKNADGKLEIPGGKIDVSVCKDLAPDPWPPSVFS